MSCPNRIPRSSGNWNTSMNTTFDPSSASTPRGASPQNPNDYQSPIKPQQLFTPRSNGPHSTTPHAGYYNDYAPNQSVPEYYQPQTQRSPTPNRSRPPPPNPNTPYITRKIIYETSNISPESYTSYAPRSPARARINQPPTTHYYSELPPQSRAPPKPQPTPESYASTYPSYIGSDPRSQSPKRPSYLGSYSSPTRNETKAWATPTPSQIGKQDRPPCPGSCSSGKGKMDKLYNDFVASLRIIIISTLIRRKRMRSCMEQSLKWSHQDMDCKEKRAQEKAANQMENNFRAEIVSIYNDLMNRRKQLYHEMNHEKNSKGSLVSINAPINKSAMFANPLNQSEIKDDEKNIANQFTKLIVELINEFCAKDIELADEYSSLAESDIDSDTMSAYHHEYMKLTDQMEEDFIATWENYENNKCGCAPGEDFNELIFEMGLALQEILAKQFKICEELEKKLEDECTECQSSKSKSFPHSDRLELNNVHVDIMNDLWYAMDAVKQVMEQRDTEATMENYEPIFRALLAVFRKCHAQVKIMLDHHYEKRRVHQVENLSSIFVDEWIRLRKETNTEIKTIIDSLNFSSNSNMTCQERRLKKIQDMEKAEILDKYRADRDSYPCRSKDIEGDLNEQLAALQKSHSSQWDTMLWNKLQKKVEEIEKVYPKESKEACAQTCTNSKKTSKMEEIEEDDEIPCVCDPSDMDEDKPTKSDHNLSSSSSDTIDKVCSNTRGRSSSPDLGELSDIEVKEMKELQKNLRQWQLARRNLLESINRGLKK